MTVWAIVVAGGRGERFAASGAAASPTPKQFVELAGETITARSTRTAAACCDGVVLVVPADLVGAVRTGADAVVAGGAARADSVRAGLAAVPSDVDVVVVHDAARPLATSALFVAVVDAVRRGADAAVPALPVTDTVKRVVDGRVAVTVPRDDLVAVQTPQAFRAAVLRAAHEGAPDASDDAALVERAGGTVAVVPGDAHNLKVTTPADLVVAEALLRDGAVGTPR